VRYVLILGSAVRGLMDLSIGRIQGYVHNDLKPWDIAAGCLIFEEAGGKVTDFKGNFWDPWNREIVASCERIHKDILKIVGSV
jgi:myo-inositol-1(or 4)-monophosphatase